MNTTRKPTKAEVLALARKKWPHCELRENPKAPTAEQRTAGHVRWRELDATRKRLTEEARAAGDVNKALREAARFAVDVDGDEPSWTQLREALERAERVAAILEERREAEVEQRSCQRHGSRWDVYSVDRMPGIGGVCVVHASADTLEQLMERLRAM